MLVLTEMSELTAQLCTLTTEEWKAEQQLERDAQASTTVPVKNEACDLERAQARICEQPSANETAWPGSRLKYRGHDQLRERTQCERAGGNIEHGWRV